MPDEVDAAHAALGVAVFRPGKFDDLVQVEDDVARLPVAAECRPRRAAAPSRRPGSSAPGRTARASNCWPPLVGGRLADHERGAALLALRFLATMHFVDLVARRTLRTRNVDDGHDHLAPNRVDAANRGHPTPILPGPRPLVESLLHFGPHLSIRELLPNVGKIFSAADRLRTPPCWSIFIFIRHLPRHRRAATMSMTPSARFPQTAWSCIEAARDPHHPTFQPPSPGSSRPTGGRCSTSSAQGTPGR